MKQQNKKAFTLVELVVVVAVLLILAAIAIPIVGGVINNAHIATDESNAKSIETAIKYAIAHNEIGDDISDTVGDALELSGMDTAKILDPEQPGYGFYYDNIGQSVVPLTGPRTPNDILLDGTNTLNADGTVGAGTGLPTSSTTTSTTSTTSTVTTGVTIGDFSMTVGDVKALNTIPVTYAPSGATDTAITWTRTNGTGTATISSGDLTANTAGTVTLRAALTSNTTVYDECTVTITNAVVVTTGVSIIDFSMTTGDVKALSTVPVTYTTNTGGTATDTAITWTRTNGTGTATISGGNITANTAGTVTLRAALTSDITIYDECTITITNPIVVTTGLSISNFSMVTGASKSLSTVAITYTTNTGGAATDTAVTWSVTNGTGSASISSGNLVAGAAGTVTLKATLNSNNAVFGTCTVTITLPVTMPSTRTVDDNDWFSFDMTASSGSFSIVHVSWPGSDYYRYSVGGVNYKVTTSKSPDHTSNDYLEWRNSSTLRYGAKSDNVNSGSVTTTITISFTNEATNTVVYSIQCVVTIQD